MTSFFGRVGIGNAYCILRDAYIVWREGYIEEASRLGDVYP